MTPNPSPKKKKKVKRGFAALNPEQRRNMAKKGGTAAHKKGTGYQFTRKQMSQGGRKGGKKVSENRKHMREIGRRGGKN